MAAGRILLVDDEPSILVALQRSLQWDGYEIFTAPHAAAALEVMQAQPIDVAMSDLTMPGQTGIDLFAQMHALWPDTVRVMLTAEQDHEVALSALDRGSVFRYLTKPWNEFDLRSTVRLAMARRSELVESKHLLDFMDRRHAQQLDALVNAPPNGLVSGKA